MLVQIKEVSGQVKFSRETIMSIKDKFPNPRIDPKYFAIVLMLGMSFVHAYMYAPKM